LGEAIRRMKKVWPKVMHWLNRKTRAFKKRGFRRGTPKVGFLLEKGVRLCRPAREGWETIPTELEKSMPAIVAMEKC